MDHQSHIAKPKIAKNASSKLPQAFRMQASSSKRASQPFEQIKTPHSQAKHEKKEQVQKQVQKKQRKSKNPFLPVKQFIKKAEEFAKEMREANEDIQKFSRYSFEAELKEKGKIKYENCITLSIVRRNASSCLKKVLHVPTLTVHFLRESLISAHFDKGELNEWVGIINQKQSSNCIKILEIFWNMPEDYYSLLYEYSEGLLLDSLNESLNTLPIGLLRDIAAIHLTSSVGIYNSQLILYQEAGSKVIKYLPLYQQTDFLVGQSKKMKEITACELGNDVSNIQNRFIWKLGLILMNGYLGSVIFNQDIEKVSYPLKKCCLLHQILTNTSCLSGLYLSLNSIEDQPLCQFLCKCLRSKKHSEKQHRIELKNLRNHKFLLKKYGQIISLGQMIEVVDPSSNTKSKFQINKMNKIMDSVSLILQNVSDVEAKITVENKDVVWLARELGMAKEVDKIVNELKKVYKE